MSFEMKCLDYEGTSAGRVNVDLGRRPVDGSKETLDHISLAVRDLDNSNGSIVYMTVEQARKVVIALVTAMKEISGGTSL